MLFPIWRWHFFPFENALDSPFFSLDQKEAQDLFPLRFPFNDPFSFLSLTSCGNVSWSPFFFSNPIFFCGDEPGEEDNYHFFPPSTFFLHVTITEQPAASFPFFEMKLPCLILSRTVFFRPVTSRLFSSPAWLYPHRRSQLLPFNNGSAFFSGKYGVHIFRPFDFPFWRSQPRLIGAFPPVLFSSIETVPR